MRNALRPYMTAGVAVVGASTLAIAPVIATPPDVKIVNPAVQSAASPLDTYVDTVREALENLEALLGSALALPAPTGWTLELALDSLFNDPSGDVQLFVDDLEALGPLAGASLPALLENAAARRRNSDRPSSGRQLRPGGRHPHPHVRDTRAGGGRRRRRTAEAAGPRTRRPLQTSCSPSRSTPLSAPCSAGSARPASRSRTSSMR